MSRREASMSGTITATAESHDDTAINHSHTASTRCTVERSRASRGGMRARRAHRTHRHIVCGACSHYGLSTERHDRRQHHEAVHRGGVVVAEHRDVGSERHQGRQCAGGHHLCEWTLHTACRDSRCQCLDDRCAKYVAHIHRGINEADRRSRHAFAHERHAFTDCGRHLQRNIERS